ncbi:transcription elongation factor GreA [Candidatus Roizmanbacteria bacterium]|nr:transcription elongation factor GreA [Candidatus Roizmanbacteria bacterium]
MKKFQFTQEGYNKLQLEHDDLVKNKRSAAIDRLQKARAMGDLSENSEYVAAKEDLAFVEGRIQELEELFKYAEIVEQTVQEGVADLGSKITVDINGKQVVFTLVGEFEADPAQRKLSQTSPIGQALFGKKIGESVEIEVPAGKLLYKILDIQNN